MAERDAVIKSSIVSDPGIESLLKEKEQFKKAELPELHHV